MIGSCYVFFVLLIYNQDMFDRKVAVGTPRCSFYLEHMSTMLNEETDNGRINKVQISPQVIPVSSTREIRQQNFQGQNHHTYVEIQGTNKKLTCKQKLKDLPEELADYKGCVEMG